uniref:disintegrin and metalloproteinase domain-containing protein 9-like n=1 Tax=Euleptes europaea TaxID=460621 RepID=UPI00254140AB|nr:disintegrin and metalloproteinase domain-containing protein 9-like [Euleptes europaea]
MLLESSLPGTVCISHVPLNYASYEVIIPWQISSRVGKAKRDQISYVIKAEGKNHIVHLKQKEIIIKKFPVFTYKQDRLQLGYHEIQHDCYYHGYVEGSTDSFVSLSTCSGLRGTFQVDNATYNIDPLEGSHVFQHLVYRVGEDKFNPGTCRLRGEAMPYLVADLVQEQILRKQKVFNPWKHSKYLELFVQVDLNMFKRYDQNVSLTVLRVVQLIQMVDDMFFALGLRILLVGIEIWTEKNKVLVTNFLNDTIAFFNRWRVKKHLLRLQHDVGILLHARSRGQMSDAYGTFGSLCDEKHAAALLSTRQMALLHFAIAVAHEIGHVIGMPDDESNLCYCGPSNKCIMSPQGPSGENPLFSNCSARSYFHIIWSRKAQCLNNIPDNSRLFAQRSCGNGIVEEGEECDCGDKEPCKKDMCCQEDCTKAKGALCTTELCCRECGVAPKGTLCREATGECDLPEYCSGKTVECPPDIVVQDGSPCSDNGYCYSGTCSTHTLLCQKIFGIESQSGPLSCYQTVNSMGDRFGNCGGQAGDGEPTDFKKCDQNSILCGQVQCVNIHTLPQLDEHTTVIQTPSMNAMCWGLDRHIGITSSNAGAVEDGTKCGKGRVCNSNQNCHCLYGWEPPGCSILGYGGSTDSGPAPRAAGFSKVDFYVGAGVAVGFGLVVGVLLVMVLCKWRQVSDNPQGD